MKVSVDFETRSPVDIRKHGAYRYFEHPEARVLMAAYRIDDGPLKCWIAVPFWGPIFFIGWLVTR